MYQYYNSYNVLSNFLNQNNITEVYPKIEANRTYIHLGAVVKNLDDISYSDMKCIPDGDIFPNNPNHDDLNNTNNSLINYQNTNSSSNNNYGNNDKDPSFSYKDSSLVDF